MYNFKMAKQFTLVLYLYYIRLNIGIIVYFNGSCLAKSMENYIYSIFSPFYAPFEEEGVYCFALVGRSVGWSVDKVQECHKDRIY